ncbi:MAG: DotU family type IV/VI secretion system protein [Gammaproteobacteria bacterium]|nr:DotU family type IV/VI secretion system protein [Gammaproteobacteria bacterium]
MEREHSEMNIENWANSIVELEENSRPYDPLPSAQISSEQAALIPLTMPTYYRSKAFSSTIGINKLINAADPILTLVTKLRQITIPPEVTILHQNLCHEIKAFENKAQTLGYRSQLILAARFVICALVDELIAITLWPGMEWKKYNLVDTFHKDPWEDDRFFLILDRSLQDASGHLDLLELIFVSLRLGYEGKYRTIERGHLELRNITDNLYFVITQYREEFSRSLLISFETPSYHLLRKKHYFHLLPPTWIISAIMIVSLLIMFTFFYLKLIETASPIAELLSNLQTKAPVSHRNNTLGQQHR